VAPRGSGDDSLRFDVEVDAAQGRKELRDLLADIRRLGAGAVETGGKVDDSVLATAKSYRQLGREIEQVSRMDLAMERSVQAARAQTARTKAASSNATTAQVNAVAAPALAANKIDLAAERVATQEATTRAKVRQAENAALKTQSDLLLNNARIEDLQARGQERRIGAAEKSAQREMAAQARVAAQQDRIYNDYLSHQAKQGAAAERAALREVAAKEKVAAQQDRIYNDYMSQQSRFDNRSPLGDGADLAATRYALYDVAQTAGIAGLAVASIGASSVVMASKFEASYADVRRAAELTGEEAASVQKQLLEISNTAPVSFEDVSSIATLGAQMGIASNDLDKFSSTVSKFAATTDVTVDNAAQSFGRISNLLDVPADQFDKLGSSIYEVGIKTVATESEILSTTNQIAGAAAAYNFTADEVVGLSAAFASLGVAPEAARGSVTKIFGDIEKAVAKGGDDMSEYARILKTDVAGAQELWMKDPSAFFSQLVQGLSESKVLINDLESIGIKDRRDTNLMQRLTGNPELLINALDVSKNAFNEGTALADGYAVTMETLAAKFTIFINNLKSLAATAGAPLLGPLGLVLDVLSKFMGLLSDAPILTGFIVVLSLLVGGFLLLKSAQAAAIAGLLALKFVMDQMSSSTGLTSISFRSLSVTLRTVAADAGITRAALFGVKGATDAGAVSADGNSRSMRAMGLAMRAIGAIGLVATLGQIAYSLTETYLKSQQAAQGLRDVQDATGEISSDTLVASAQKSLEAVRMFEDQFNGRGDMFEQINAQVGSFFNQFINALPGMNNANSELEAIDQRLASMVSSGNAENAAALIERMGLSTEEAAARFPGYVEAIAAADDPLMQVADAADEAEGDISSMSDALDDLFSNLNSASAFGDSIQQLFSGIYDGGTAFDFLSEAGRTNLANLQQAMADTIAYGQTAGLSAADSLVPLFAQLQASGVDTATLLQVLASQPYEFTADLDISAVQAKLAAIGKITTGSFGGSGKGGANNAFSGLGQNVGILANNLNRAAVSAPKAAKGLSGAGKAAKAAKKEVRTLSDYVSDLEKVFNDSTQYRFGVQDGLDDVQSKWDDINKEILDNRDKMKEAQDSVRDYADEIASLRADILGLQSDINQKEYFLTVAVKYDDQLRAGDLRAGIASDQADIASKQNDIAEKARQQAEAQRVASGATDMSTKSAVEQREELSALYKTYQDLILEYARSGMTQGQLTAKVAELRQGFVQQAMQAGYSGAEIGRYSNAFDDLTYSINNVPRNITVAANTNPAHRALNEFLARAAASKADVSTGSSNAGSAGTSAGLQFASNFNAAAKPLVDQVLDVGRNAAQNLFNLTMPKSTGSRNSGGGRFAEGGFVPGRNAFPSGGFVPGSAPTNPQRDNKLGMLPNGSPIALQGGEPIINNAARSMYGDGMFEAINAMKFKPQVVAPVTYMSGGAQETIAYLSAEDRALLRAALGRPVVAQVEYVETARAAAEGNKILTLGG